MFGEKQPNSRTFIFDFKAISIARRCLSGVDQSCAAKEKFDSLEALITQMTADSAAPAAILTALMRIFQERQPQRRPD